MDAIMNCLFHPLTLLRASAAAVLLAAIAGCGGGIDPILGTPPAGNRPTVSSTLPATSTPAATGVDTHAVLRVNFSRPMLASTINATSFTVACPAATPVAASVAVDATTLFATLTPTAALPPSTTCVANVAADVQDAAGIALGSAYSWSFVTGTATATVNLGSAASFGAFGGAAGVTNQGINTVVGGDLGSTAACSLITGLHDPVQVYTETPLNIGAVSGRIQCGPPAPGTTASLAVATQARADALTAYNALAALPPGSDPGAGQLGGLVLAAGTYTAAGGTFAVTTGNLTLDAQGDPNAVWVFQSAAALTVGLTATPRTVQVINGGQAKNVYWQVGSAARIEDGSTMVGTLIAPSGITFSTAGQTVQTRLTGRAIGLTASVTLVNTTIVAP
jgi:hypothetical protein